MSVSKGGKKGSQTLLLGSGLVTEWRTHLHIHGQRERSMEAERKSSVWLEIDGDFQEPISGITRFSILATASNEPKVGQTKVASIGSFVRTKPTLQGVVELTNGEFQMLMMLAVNDKLKSCCVVFCQPFRNRSLIIRVSFSSQRPDENEVQSVSSPV